MTSGTFEAMVFVAPFPRLAFGQERPLKTLYASEPRTTIPRAAEPPMGSWRGRGAAPGGYQDLRPVERAAHVISFNEDS